MQTTEVEAAAETLSQQYQVVLPGTQSQGRPLLRSSMGAGKGHGVAQGPSATACRGPGRLLLALDPLTEAFHLLSVMRMARKRLPSSLLLRAR